MPDENSVAQSVPAPAPVETLQPEKDANVALAHGKSPVTVDGPINIGTFTVELPSEAQQRAGFYAKKPNLLVTQYRGVYKLFTPKVAQKGGLPNGR